MDVSVYSAMFGLRWYMLCVSPRGLQIVRSIHASRSCDFTAHAGVFTLQVLFLRPLVSGSLFGVSRLRDQDYGLFWVITPRVFPYSALLGWTLDTCMASVHKAVEIPHGQFLACFVLPVVVPIPVEIPQVQFVDKVLYLRVVMQDRCLVQTVQKTIESLHAVWTRLWTCPSQYDRWLSSGVQTCKNCGD